MGEKIGLMVIARDVMTGTGLLILEEGMVMDSFLSL